MNLAAFDLNLLTVFDALMQERNVTRAGGRIGLSQPAMSHALNRLRYVLKDELFVRTADGMVPTPRAERIAAPLRNALSEMRLALEPDTFVPGEAIHEFTIAVNNYAAVVISPNLIIAASAAAPKVRLNLRPAGTLAIADLLDRGDLDLAIGSFDALGERFALAPLLEDKFVLMMRHGHPTLRRQLTAPLLARLAHLEISSSGEDTSFLDDWLAEHRLTRGIAHKAPYLSAARILAETDIVATLTSRIAKAFLRTNILQIRELPCQSPSLTTQMLWHRRLQNQPAHQWLRKLAMDVCEDL